ncbi:hypothetical protein KNJ79_21055 (plasmid) [Sphingopyxis indica]|uniref:YciI family protein n=1 Tax=Sphingopyxis indica TaxID=436663 RepID=UPI0029393F10|nr:YciI family protein [Sphingopyxis indica]WOF45880.1 hypothetical protein KNJ79_21055 [Sphingopyxis indica]
MPLYIATIQNRQGDECDRASSVDAHRQYLRAHAWRILLGGAVLDETETKLIGAVYVFEADDLTSAQGFVNDDPLSVAGLRETIIVRPWRQALFDREFVLGTAKAGAPFPGE